MTAALARASGADFGPECDLIPADGFNPEGYLEHRPTVYLNTILQLGEYLRPAELFEDLAISRPRRFINRLSKIRYLLPSPSSVVRERARRRRLEIRAIAHGLDGHVVKDPRFCSTLHAWAEHTSIAGVLYCYRHPAEVARSQAHAYGVPLWVGYWLWLVRVREFLRNGQGLPVTFVEYGRLLDPSTATEEASRILAFLGKRATETEIEATLGAHVRRAHRRFSAQRDDVPRAAASLYELLGHYHRMHDRPTILSSANLPTCKGGSNRSSLRETIGGARQT